MWRVKQKLWSPQSAATLPCRGIDRCLTHAVLYFLWAQWTTGTKPRHLAELPPFPRVISFIYDVKGTDHRNCNSVHLGVSIFFSLLLFIFYKREIARLLCVHKNHTKSYLQTALKVGLQLQHVKVIMFRNFTTIFISFLIVCNFTEFVWGAGWFQYRMTEFQGN